MLLRQSKDNMTDLSCLKKTAANTDGFEGESELLTYLVFN